MKCYREREEAHAELAKMGRLARPAPLEAAASDPDPEVRFRCSRLLPKAGADDLKARLDTFLADTEGKYEHDLPGLKQFRKPSAGREGPRLFVETRQVALQRRVASRRSTRTRPRPGGRFPIAGTYSIARLQQRYIGGRAVAAAPIALSDIALPALRRIDHRRQGDPADGDVELRHRCELPSAELGDAGAQRQQQPRACRVL